MESFQFQAPQRMHFMTHGVCATLILGISQNKLLVKRTLSSFSYKKTPTFLIFLIYSKVTERYLEIFKNKK